MYNSLFYKFSDLCLWGKVRSTQLKSRSDALARAHQPAVPARPPDSPARSLPLCLLLSASFDHQSLFIRSDENTAAAASVAPTVTPSSASNAL